MENSTIYSIHKIRKIGIFLITLALMSSISLVSAQSNIFEYNSGGIILGLEYFLLFLYLVIVLFNIQFNKKLGNSIISLPFIYIFIGLSLTLFSRLILVLHEIKFFNVPDQVIHIYWHFFLYLSMVPFFIAIEKVADRTRDKELSVFGKKDLIIIAFLLMIDLFLILTPSTLGPKIMSVLMKTPIPKYGGLHFLAFFIALILTIRMIFVLNKTRTTPIGSYMQTISTPFFLFLVVTTLNHLTSLIFETLNIGDFNGAELIGQVFWLVGFSVMIFGYYNLNSIISASKVSETKNITEVEGADIILTIMNTLNEHLGNLAWEVFSKSSQKSNIGINKITSENISIFTDAIKSETEPLIGEFPSKYLKIKVQKQVTALLL